MRRIFISLILLLALQGIKAQINALTENGKEVVLMANGTWRYLNDSASQAITKDSTKMNTIKFTKTSGATFLVKSNITNTAIYLNSSKWTFKPHLENETNPEYRFSLKSGDAYGLMITEKTEVPLENMTAMALINAKEAAMDAVIVNKEYRIVNNTKILCIKMKCTIQGIKFIYFGYYFSNENGTTQLLTYASSNFFETRKIELENFLNGFIKMAKK